MSTRLVVNDAAVTVAVAFASTRVQLGAHAVSVSILTPRSTPGETNFFKDSLKELQASPVQNVFIAILVLAVTSPIF